MKKLLLTAVLSAGVLSFAAAVAEKTVGNPSPAPEPAANVQKLLHRHGSTAEAKPAKKPVREGGLAEKDAPAGNDQDPALQKLKVHDPNYTAEQSFE